MVRDRPRQPVRPLPSGLFCIFNRAVSGRRESPAGRLIRASGPHPCGAAIAFGDAVLSSRRCALVGWWGPLPALHWWAGDDQARAQPDARLTRGSAPRPTGGNPLRGFRPILPLLRCGRMVETARANHPKAATRPFSCTPNRAVSGRRESPYAKPADLGKCPGQQVESEAVARCSRSR